MRYRGLITLSLISLTLIIFSGCASKKKITYFQDIPMNLGDTTHNIRLSEYKEPRIQPRDMLFVSIQTLDPQANASITSLTSQTTGATNRDVGFLVDQEGNIEIPLVGKVRVAGFTTEMAREEIRKKAILYYKDPVVNVRFANFRITVLGEVQRPGSFTAPNERISLLDALGLAGDLTIFARRDNVLLIREENGEKRMTRFNLNQSQLFHSPFFYLQQGDIVYVEPDRSKLTQTEAQRNRMTVAIITASVSVLTFLLTRVIK